MRKVIIGNLDWFLMRKLDAYFDLSGDQYDHFREKGKTHLNWFKASQIPWLISEIEVIRKVEAPLAPDYMTTLVDSKLRNLWLAIVDRMASDAADLFKQMTPEQYTHLQEALAEDSEEFIELTKLPLDEFQKEYRDLQNEIMEKMETWVGSLTDAQEAKIIELTKISQEDYHKEVAILVDIKKEFIRQVQRKVKEGGVEQFLKDWARKPNIKGSQYKLYRDWKVTRQINLWIEIEKMVTPEQRKYRDKQLKAVISDLELLQDTNF